MIRRRERLLILVSLFLGIVIIFSSYRVTEAVVTGDRSTLKKGNTKRTSKVTFMIEPELPRDNRGGSSTGFFNLSASRRNRTVKIRVYNPTNQTITIGIKVVNATTLDNGSINYTDQSLVDRDILKDPGSRYIKVPHRLILKAKNTTEIPIKISSPKQSFTGQKAMAVNLYSDQSNQQAAIKNHYIYAVGLILNGQTLKIKQLKKVSVQNVGIRLNQERKPVISFRIANPDPVFLLQARAKITLQNKRWRFINYSDQKRGLKIAPSSIFYNNLSIKGYRLVPGNYQMKMEIVSRLYKRKIYKDVRITKSDAYFMNSRNKVYLRYRNLMITGVIVFSSISFTIFYKRYSRV